MTPGLRTAGSLKATPVLVWPAVQRVVVSLAPSQDIFIITLCHWQAHLSKSFLQNSRSEEIIEART